LFTSLSTKDIESRSESLGLFDTLKCDPEAFYSHMTKYVLPTVEGSDQARLLYYYTLLDAAGCEPHVTTAIKPHSHVKLLKKLRAVANGKAVCNPQPDYVYSFSRCRLTTGRSSTREARIINKRN